MHLAIPPSQQAERGARALEVGIARIDALVARLPQAPPDRISLDVSNVSAMFQQGKTISRVHLPAAPVTAAIGQAMAGMDQLTRRFHAGDPVGIDEVAARLAAWRLVAQDGIAALRAIDPSSRFAPTRA